MQVNRIAEEIKKRLSRKRNMLLIFDRDGTLVPLAADPQGAVMPPKVRESANRLSSLKGVRVAILSARGLNQLSVDFPGGGQILAGNSGLEITAPGNINFLHPSAAHSRGMFDTAKMILHDRLPAQYKTILEDHGLSLCLHFHLTPGEMQEQVVQTFKYVQEKLPNLKVKRLPTSFEVWPAFHWDKACGIEEILQQTNINPTESLIVFAGDSVPDEPAFEWVNEHQGISIGVGYRGEKSAFKLDTPAQLHELMDSVEQLIMSCATR